LIRENIKKQIYDLGLEFILIYKGKVIDDHDTCLSLQLPHESTLNVLESDAE
jgi:hypothetical protein